MQKLHAGGRARGKILPSGQSAEIARRRRGSGANVIQDEEGSGVINLMAALRLLRLRSLAMTEDEDVS